MEVHQEGVILAWQARIKNNKVFIGVAGTKAFMVINNLIKSRILQKIEIFCN